MGQNKMNKDEAIKVARELVERFNTRVLYYKDEYYVVVYADVLTGEDIKLLIPYFENYYPAIFADDRSKIRINFR